MEETESEREKRAGKSNGEVNGGLRRIGSARRFALPDVLEGVNQCDILLLNLDYEVKQEKRGEVQKCIEEKAFDKALDSVIQANRKLSRVSSAEKKFIDERETIGEIIDGLDQELDEMIGKGKRAIKQSQNKSIIP